MVDTPLVSVIMPAFNASATIACALESVLNQSIDSLELLVVDDASTDGTADIVQSVPDHRITLIRNQRQLGSGTARNMALDVARGEYVAFLDADDALHPTYLERLVSVARANRDMALVASNVWISADAGGVELVPMFTLFEDRGLVLESDESKVALADLINHHIDVKPLVPMRHIRRYGCRFPDGSVGGEWLPFLVSLVSRGLHLVLLREALYYYRVHRRNKSRLYRTALAELRLVDVILTKHYLDPATTIALLRYKTFLRRRLPWLALREGRFLTFLATLCADPGGILFPLVKLPRLLRRTKALWRRSTHR